MVKLLAVYLLPFLIAAKGVEPSGDGQKLAYSQIVKWLDSDNPEEAWRWTLLSYHLFPKLPSLLYLRQLTGYLGGSCTLSSASEHPEFSSLLHAHALRFSKREKAAAEPKEQRYFAHWQWPRLADVPRAKLLRGWGCGTANWLGTSSEMEILTEFFQRYQRGTPYLRGLERIALRIGSVRKSLTQDERAWLFSAVETGVPVLLNEEERQLLFLLLSETKEAFAVSSDHRHFKELKRLFLSLERASPFLAAFDLDSMNSETRLEFLNYTLSRESPEHSNYLLYLRSQIKIQKGEVFAALRDIQQIFSEVDSSSEIYSSEIYEAVREDSLAIFREFQYDEKVQAAIFSALPRAEWKKAMEELLISSALYSNKRAFSSLERRLLERSRRTDKNKMLVLKSLVRRDLSSLRSGLLALVKRNRRLYIRLTEKVAKQLLILPAETQENLLPVLKIWTKSLEKVKDRSFDRKKVESLQTLLVNGSEGVIADSLKYGTTTVGHIDLRKKRKVASPLQWSPPPIQYKPELLVRPDGQGGWFIR